MFIRKYDASGTLAWTRQIGTSAFERGWSISADGLGNVYFSSDTAGSLGGPNAGFEDVFLGKYDANGTLEWIRQFGTSGADWSRGGLSADGLGNVYISGLTTGNLGGPNAGETDAFLGKYDASGTLAWIRQIGTSSRDKSSAVSADGLGNAYISGSTSGDLGGPNAGESDVFISKYDASGTLAWTRQLGTSASESSYGVSADGLGSVYISGITGGDLGGPNAGEGDVFISKYDASGTLAWTRQLGTSESDSDSGVSADALGNVYISGSTWGSLGGPYAGGGGDAFVAKYNVVPEPATGIMLMLAILTAALFLRRRAVAS